MAVVTFVQCLLSAEWKLTESYAESQVALEAVSGGQDPALVDEDASAVKCPSGVQQQHLPTK